MKKPILSQRAETGCVLLLHLLCLLLFAFLFCNSFVSSWLNHELSDEFVYFQWDSLPGNLVGLLLALAILAAVVRLSARWAARLPVHRLALVLSVLVSCLSLVWVQASHTSPQADQSQIVTQAELFNAGNFDDLQRGGYVGMYQQQLGIITVLRVLAVLAPLFHTESWHLFQLCSAATAGLAVYAGYRMVARIARRREAELVYLLLAFLCAPLYLYIPFVYGESSSTAFAMAAGWMFLECLQAPRPRYLLGLFLSCALAVLLRTNTVIIMIAFGIVLVIKLLRAPSRGRLVMGVVLLLGALAPTLLTGALYRDKIPADSQPMPALLFVAMGTNDTATNAGWYNAYNRLQYEASGFDPQTASAVAREDLAAFAARCQADPAYAADFYYRKISSQWNAPLYQCLAMNSRIEGPQPPLVRSIYQGRGNGILTAFMNLYQMLVYGGVLLFAGISLKKRPPLEHALLLVAVFGGFLFSVLWEAKARYVFPYFLLMLPWAAMGLAAFLTGCWHLAERRNARQN